MAPNQQNLSTIDNTTTYDELLMTRDQTHVINSMDSQTLAVMCVSLSFAAISVIAALFAFYWFVRMRRGFRQDMIMLLIQSDMAKALWLIISPLFHFITQKPFNSNWAFCQVSGFFLTVTIEASDIAVLLIAIHTALFIVKRKHPGAAVGLQPYRRIAYTLWATVPLILAAIVPLTGSSFVDNGPHCYLPIHPAWYRSALAWVPRYIIFGFIIVTYTWLYIYLFIRFRGFSEDRRRASSQISHLPPPYSRWRSRQSWKSRSVPPTPHINTQGPFESARDKISKTNAPKVRRSSLASTVSTLHLGESLCMPAAPPRAERRSSVSWDLIDFRHDRNRSRSSASITSQVDVVTVSPTTRPFTPASTDSDENDSMSTNSVRAPESTHAADGSDAPSHNPRSSRTSILRRKLTQASSYNSCTIFRNSLASVTAALRPGPHSTDEANEANEVGSGEQPPSSSIYLETEMSDETTQRSRDKVQRQMRLLFIYPAIYMLTWVAPFVAHVYRYDDVYAVPSRSIENNATTFSAGSGSGRHDDIIVSTEPISLRLVSMASLCIGAAVDCCFFSTWERPWRHLRGGFWEGLAMRLRINRLCGAGSGERTGGPGRSRDERVADERAARTRRDRETEMILALRSATGGRSSGEGSGGEGRSGRSGENQVRREWWDALDEPGS
ncbi:G protein-coupled glucose receptor regulating Gpa2-domain-containing protein [Xylaria nigripes]|nr:G protein-coupled glucose receptor regulating Gpa2-domain-containing protein [Xylaria nigripes]